MPTEVTDPALLAQLNSSKEVTDPALLAQLNGAAPTSNQWSAGRVIGDVADAGAAGLSNVLVGGVGGSVASLGAKLTGQDPDAAKRWVDENLVYHAHTPDVQALTEALSKTASRVAAPVKAGMQSLDTATDSSLAQHPELQDALRKASGVSGMANSDIADFANVAPAGAIAASAIDTAKAARAAVNAPVLEAGKAGELNSAGYSMRPSDVSHLTPGATPSLLARALESSVGSGAAARELSIKNAKVSQESAATAIGANLSKTGGRFTDQVFTDLKAPNNKVYGELAALPGDGSTPAYADALAALDTKGMSPEASAAIDKLRADYAMVGNSKDAVASVRSLRARASKQIQSDNPDMQERGWAAKKIADAIDDQLAERAIAVDPTLADRFKAARQNLAKINTVEDATKGGIVDAKAILSARNHGAPLHLTPELNSIADAAENIPNVTRHPSSYAVEESGDVPTTLAGALQAVARNVGGRAILNRGYQNSLAEAVGKRNPELFLPGKPRPDINQLVQALMNSQRTGAGG